MIQILVYIIWIRQQGISRDRQSAEILVYNEEGNFQFKFGGKGESEGKFRLISGIAVDNESRIYVADSRQRPIQIFDIRGGSSSLSVSMARTPESLPSPAVSP